MVCGGLEKPKKLTGAERLEKSSFCFLVGHIKGHNFFKADWQKTLWRNSFLSMNLIGQKETTCNHTNDIDPVLSSVCNHSHQNYKRKKGKKSTTLFSKQEKNLARSAREVRYNSSQTTHKNTLKKKKLKEIIKETKWHAHRGSLTSRCSYNT